MKKLLMAVALALGGAAQVQAANSTSQTGTLNVTVNDYITMTPSSNFVYGPIGFSDPLSMTEGWFSGNRTYTIVASRAWKFETTTTDFLRQGGSTGAGPGVATVVPAGNLLSYKTTSSSSGVFTTNGTFIPATTTPLNLAYQNTGTLTSTFIMNLAVVPGLNNQMSGTYMAQILNIASLD